MDILTFHQMVDFITCHSQNDGREGSIIDHVYINTPELIQYIQCQVLGKVFTTWSLLIFI